MKVLYLLQTYKDSPQIKDLVNTIKRLSKNAQVLISHDSNWPPLTDEEFTTIPGVYLIYLPAGRGSFSLIQSYLNSLKWLFDNQIEFDWIVNLSSNCYPTQPLSAFEKFLAETQYDGFIEYRDVLDEKGYYGLRESLERYFYQYWHSGIRLSTWQRALLKPIRIVVNNSQPFVKILSSYQLSLGIRDFQKRFDTNFKCYGGSWQKILSKKCAMYLLEMAEKRVDLVEYYKRTNVPDESFIQTLLANSNSFNLCDKNLFYIDWRKSKHGHPKILTIEDYSIITQREDIYFARKFDTAIDSEILDMLNRYLLQRVTQI